MSFLAKIHFRSSGKFALSVHTAADSLSDAEDKALAIACFHLRADPRELEARHVHQQTPS